jgi:outer membrane receptor protein involved in Fe transport
MQKLLAVVFACTLIATPRVTILAQSPGTVEGVVRSASAEPLGFATVEVEGLHRRTLTDGRGHFRLELPAGEHSLVVRRIGYESRTRTVTVRSGQTVTVEFELPEAATVLPELVVTATREPQRLAETAASIAVASAADIDNVRPGHPSQIANRLAGVWINVTGGEGHMTAIRHPLTTDPVYLYLEDGIPIRSTGFFNHNALYEVNLPQAGGIEVMKGPATALYGSDAIGGVINVETRPPSQTPELSATVEGGRYGWMRFLGSASNTWRDHGLRADLNLTRTTGWRESTDYHRESGTLRWDYSAGSGLLKTVVSFSNIDQQTAGSSAISEDDYLNRPTVNYTPISYRRVQALRISTAYQRVTTRSLLTVTPFGRYNAMEILPNWTLTFDPAIWDTKNFSAGLLLRYRYDLEQLRTRLIAGADLDYSPGGRKEWAINPTREGKIFTSYTEGQPLYDYDVTFLGASPYIHSEFALVERLRLTAGLRFDVVGYDYTNHLSVVTEGRHRRPPSTSVSYTHASPKLGLTYSPAEAVSFFAAYRHGFRVPSENQLFRQGQAAQTVGLEPVKVNSYELGVRGQLLRRLRYDLAGYQMRKTDDIVGFTHPDGSQETLNAGQTRHRGVEAAVTLEVTPFLRLVGAYSYTEHRYIEWRPRANLDFSGKEMEQAPRTVASAVVDFAPDFLNGGNLSVELNHIGPYWMDAANTQRYDGHYLVSVRGSAVILPGAEVFFRILNLTDRRYAERAQYTAARGREFAPGMPRTVYAGIRYQLRRRG